MATLTDARTPTQPPWVTFRRWTLAQLALTLGVILFGAVVRITGSGAGCGQHWPTCQGEVIHLPTRVETAIELGHRVTSGLALLGVLGLTVFAFRAFARGHRVRRIMLAASGFMIVEALVGAILVLLELVADDASAGRAVVMPLHLVNTSFLTASLVLSAWCASPQRPAGEPREGTLLVRLGLGLFLLVSAMGAVTALGDTVAPPAAAPLAERLGQDLGAGAPFLARLRIVHPLLAVGVAGFLLYLAPIAARRAKTQAAETYARWVQILTALEVGIGAFNVLLSAPGWLQLCHLCTASLLWLSLVLLAAESGELRGLSRAEA